MIEDDAPIVLLVADDSVESRVVADALEATAGVRVERCPDPVQALARIDDSSRPRPRWVLLGAAQAAAAREGALQAVRSRSAFVAAMSHEIRTPLNAILGMADLLARTPLDLEQRQYVEILRRCGRALKGLLDNALDLSRLETGELRPDEEPFALEVLVDECLEAFAFAAHRKGVAVLGDVDEEVAGTAVGDESRLRQVLMNLLGNAVKFTDAGRVLLRVRSVADGVEFEVSDTGMGIPAERQDAIFERFVQAGSDTARRFGGSGLGLALSREIAEALGGTIAVESEPDRGSRFRLRLPLRVDARRPRPRLDGQRVLAVLGNPDERGTLARRLRARGAEVVEADSVQMGRAALAAEAFTVLLVDARLPGGGGVELLEGADAPESAGRVVLLPMDHRIGDQSRCEALRAVALCKPLRWDELDAALRGEPVRAATRPGAPAPPRRPHARVLLAEDSPDNRTVVLAFLAPTGCAVEVAANGEEALARVEAGGIDLVLMDVHMPRLDGCEAARRIRAWEASSGGPRTPIIALTADALPEQRAAIREAGCDAHLPKPFGRDELYEVMRRFLPSREKEGMEQQREAAAPGGVHHDVPPELADLAEEYLARRRADAESLRAAAREGRFDEARRLGHNMKGSGGGYGFARVSELGAEIQYASEGRDSDEIERLAGELDDYARKVLLELAGS